MKNINIFDPTDLPIGPELVMEPKTPESAYIPDTSGDPVGSEDRAKPDGIQLPDYFFKKYSLDDEGNPTYNSIRVKGILAVYQSKKDTPFSSPSSDKTWFSAYQADVKKLVDGITPLLEVDPQTTGINLLQLCTRTWAEFASIAFEYNEDATAANPNDDLPTWLIEREDKMFQLGRKARMLRDAISQIDNAFGLRDVKLNDNRVKSEVERRLQRLAQWNFDNVADKSVKVATDMNRESHNHTKRVFDLA